MGTRRRWPWGLLAGLVGAIVLGLLLLRERGDAPSSGSAGAPAQAEKQLLPDAPALPETSAPELANAGAPSPLVRDESAPAAPGDGCSLRVSVRWESDGRPAAGVALRLYAWGGVNPRRHPLTSRTDEAGEWQALGVPPGALTVYGDRGGSASTSLERGEAGQLVVNIPAGITVRGLVTDDAGAPVAGADIYLFEWFDTHCLAPAARSDAAGRFELRDMRHGMRLQARARSLSPSTAKTVQGSVGDIVETTLVLGGPACSVRGHVADAAGQPVGNAIVRVGAMPRALSVSTDADGSFLAEGVRSGLVQLQAIAAGHSPAEKQVSPGAGETVDVALVLRPSTCLVGSVRDAQGHPREAPVRIGEFGDFLAASTTSDSDGRFELQDLPTGQRTVTAELPSVGKATVRLRFEPGGRLTWDAILGAGATITGTLLDARGAPVEGVRIEARPLDGVAVPVVGHTDAAGAFALPDVSSSPQRLVGSGGVLRDLELELAPSVEPATRDLLLRLPDGFAETSRVVGRITDAKAAPLAGVVRLQHSVSGDRWKGQADGAAGSFEAGPLPLGRYELRVQVDDRPERRFPDIDVPAGDVVDLGALVMPLGGRLVVHLQLPASLPADDQASARVFGRALDGSWSRDLKFDGSAWVSPMVPAGPYQVTVWCRGAATMPCEARVEEGRDSEVNLTLLPAVTQSLRLFAPAPDEDTLLSISVRSPSGAVAWQFLDATVPARDGPVAEEGDPLLILSTHLLPGTYVVDVTLGGRSLTAATRTTDAAVPWDFELR